MWIICKHPLLRRIIGDVHKQGVPGFYKKLKILDFNTYL